MLTALLPPGNISSGTWTWRDPLLGFSFGFINHHWVKLINYNAMPSEEKKNYTFIMQVISVCVSYQNLCEIGSLAHLTSLSPLRAKAIEFGGYVTVALNVATFFGDFHTLDLSEAVGIGDKICVIAFKATPYLMIITNVALMVLQLRSNQIGAVVGLATVLFIPLLRSLPERLFDMAYYRIGRSLQAITFYYGDNWSRFWIISSVILSMNPVQKRLCPIIESLMDQVYLDHNPHLKHNPPPDICVCKFCSGYPDLKKFFRSAEVTR
jgi:hypothetical protein